MSIASYVHRLALIVFPDIRHLYIFNPVATQRCQIRFASTSLWPTNMKSIEHVLILDRYHNPNILQSASNVRY